MNPTFFTPTTRPLGRRAFLRGAGVALSLPFLDAMLPAFASAQEKKAAAQSPRRMVAMQTNMGILPQFFFPEQAGRDYRPSPYLEILKDFRDELTVFSGVSHPGVDGGHQAEMAFLTAAPHPGSGAFRNSISLDQFAAERIGSLTRFPSLVLHVGGESGSLSYTRGGVKIPAERSAAALYRRMFVQGTPQEIDARIEDLRVGRSILDFVNDSAKKLQRDLGAKDRERLDQYFTSVRELEGQLVRVADWERRPKPQVAVPPPTDVTDAKQFVQWSRLMFEMTRLALETDSTRLVTIFIDTTTLHALTHHGNRPETLADLRKNEEGQMRALAEFLASLRRSREGGETVLQRTMVLYGTCMGSANSHANTNLPVLLAGGGFRHGQHLAFDKQKNYPLPNLFVSMLQRLGIEVDKFASSTGTLRGLDMA